MHMWKETNKLLIYKHPNFSFKSKIAILDPSIVNNHNEIDMDVIKRIKNSHSIFVISNEASYARQKKLYQKVEEIIKYVPVICLSSLVLNRYSKPHRATWLYIKAIYQKVNIPIESSIVISSNAGRINEDGAFTDLSSIDRMFALNCGLEFFTPEEFSGRRRKEQFSFLTGCILPSLRKELIDNINRLSLENKRLDINNDAINLIFVIGMPRCGKSSYCQLLKRQLETDRCMYVVLDHCQTKKTFKECKKLIDDRINVILDGCHIKEWQDMYNELPCATTFINLNCSEAIAKVFNHMAIEQDDEKTLVSDREFVMYKRLANVPDTAIQIIPVINESRMLMSNYY